MRAVIIGIFVIGTAVAALPNLISGASESQSLEPGFQIGAPLYIDRDYTVTEAPDILIGNTYIQTANADKEWPEDPEFLTFDIDQRSDIYVAYDVRLDAPAWLQEWEATGLSMASTDTTFDLYRKTFEAGQVVLGANEGTSRSSMYSVIAVPAPEPTPTPTSTPTPAPSPTPTPTPTIRELLERILEAVET
jgi:hypothetical protein